MRKKRVRKIRVRSSIPFPAIVFPRKRKKSGSELKKAYKGIKRGYESAKLFSYRHSGKRRTIYSKKKFYQFWR